MFRPDSINKLCYQLSSVSKVDFEYLGTLYTTPTRVLLSDAFFREYKCLPHCGGCCPSFTLDYLPEEWEQFSQNYPQYQHLGVSNDVEISFPKSQQKKITPTFQIPPNPQFITGPSYKGDRTSVIPRCQFLQLDSGYCGVHQSNPLSCRIELIKFWRYGTEGRVLKGMIGRSWVVMTVDSTRGALCQILPEASATQIRENDLPILRTMLEWSRRFGIGTWLPELITYIEDCVDKGEYRGIAFSN